MCFSVLDMCFFVNSVEEEASTTMGSVFEQDDSDAMCMILPTPPGFSVESFLPILVNLVNMEGNPEIMLLACRCCRLLHTFLHFPHPHAMLVLLEI